MARFPSGLRDQEHQRETPENKRKQERLRDLHIVVIKYPHCATQYSRLGLEFIKRGKMIEHV